MAIDVGSRVGAYEITGLVGEGGMGRVFRARDTTLGRDVALKVLPELVAADPERRSRFEREAKTLAALNHPHIAHVYGFEQSGPTPVLVMELVDGEDLAQRVARGPIDVGEALAIARQIAGAIETAHEHGIIHRDLKPANIKLSADGGVKVLDFGLAKAIDAGFAGASSGSAAALTSPTITSPAMTMHGTILGTAAYMSPEQARGKPADKRADIWAFGCVLYEMLTGARAFDGDEVSDTLASVLRAEPDWSRLPAATPPAISKLLRGCLRKDRRNRTPDIAVARLEIDDALSGIGEAQATPLAAATRVPSIAVAAGAAAAASILTAIVVWRALAPSPTPLRPAQRFALPTPRSAPYAGAERGDFAISPDGTHLVYPVDQPGGTRSLFLLSLDQAEPRELPATGYAVDPFFSPDGEWIAFFQLGDRLGSRASLSKMSLRGGPAIELCEVSNPFGGVWAADGTIVFSTGGVRGPTAESTLFRVSGNGGAPQRIEVATGGDRRIGFVQGFPDLLPGGKGVLYSIRRELREESRIVLTTPQSTSPRTIVDRGSHARYVSSGHIVYVVGSTLMAVPFDLDRLEVRGGPVPLVDGIGTSLRGNASFAVSPTGFLIYAKAARAATNPMRTLVWVDRNGREEPFAPPRQYYYPRVSPDGRRIALDIREGDQARLGGASADIWIWDVARQISTRFTTDPGDDQYPVWTPDGKRILFSSIGGSRPAGIYWQSADGTGETERIVERIQASAPYSFAPDATQFVLRETNVQTSDDIVAVTMPQRGGSQSTAASVTPLIHSSFAENNAEISPDGKWIAYQSNESGRNEVYVRPFPYVEGGKTLVSNKGGTRPVWARDGRELFYLMGASPDRVSLVRVPLQPGATLSAGTPAVLFEGAYFASLSPAARGRTYDVMPDGRRFVMVKDIAASPAGAPEPAEPFVAILNWFDELRRVAPPGK